MLFIGATPALADDPKDRDCVFACDRVVVNAVDDHFNVKQERKHRGPSDPVPNRGKLTDGESAEKQTWTHTDEYITPYCSGNGLHGGDAMCMAAATYCQDGRVGFWVWHQVTTFTRDPAPAKTVSKKVGSWTQEDGIFCLGADDPGVPTIGKVVSWVQDHFEDLAILPATVKAAPAPRTLVNIETRLSAGSAAVVDIPASTPWANVVVHAKPLRWRWHYGDGTVSPALTTPDTTHVYREARLHDGVYVEVEWGGTFTVVGGTEAYPIVGTAVVRSEDVTLDVREARSQLVSR
jgi:hypothetical protein